SKEWARGTDLGTRHTAALGLSERTDALCIVVSEERGTVTATRNGKLEMMPDLRSLQTLLEDHLADAAPRPALATLFSHNLREKAIGLGVSSLMWAFFAGAGA